MPWPEVSRYSRFCQPQVEPCSRNLDLGELVTNGHSLPRNLKGGGSVAPLGGARFLSQQPRRASMRMETSQLKSLLHGLGTMALAVPSRPSRGETRARRPTPAARVPGSLRLLCSAFLPARCVSSATGLGRWRTITTPQSSRYRHEGRLRPSPNRRSINLAP